MKKYLSSLLCLLLGFTVFTACNNNDNYLPDREHSVVADGVFIVNEGSYYSQINGTIDYLNYSTNAVNRSVFKNANGRSLGGTPNSAVICNHEIYIACTDENRVEVMNDSTFSSVAQITVESPREVATDGEYVYVSSYTGKVTKISSTHQVVSTSAIIGSHLEGIVVLNGYVYVCNSTDGSKQYKDPDYYLNSVLRLDKTSLGKDKEITVEKNPTALLTDGTYVYVLCSGNYSTIKGCIEKISNQDNSVTKIAEATMMAYNNGNYIYYVNAPSGGAAPTYGSYNITSQTTVDFTINSPKFPYSMGVDPISGDIFISALSPNPDYPSYASYTTDGILYRYSSTWALKNTYTIGVNPGTLVFKNHSQAINK